MLGPFVGLIRRAGSILVIPDGPLYLTPWERLLVPASEGRPEAPLESLC